MRFTVNPNVIFEELDGQTVLLQLEGGVYYKLNGPGSRIWALIQEHGDLEKVHTALEGEYRVDPETARRDVASLVEDLEGRGLIVVDRS
jgi:coenzyme PQQ synthesis protein D (PqqD)